MRLIDLIRRRLIRCPFWSFAGGGNSDSHLSGMFFLPLPWFTCVISTLMLPTTQIDLPDSTSRLILDNGAVGVGFP